MRPSSLLRGATLLITELDEEFRGMVMQMNFDDIGIIDWINENATEIFNTQIYAKFHQSKLKPFVLEPQWSGMLGLYASSFIARTDDAAMIALRWNGTIDYQSREEVEERAW